MAQPDFTAITEGFRLLAKQFDLCRNIPAIDQGAHLLQLLQALNESVTRLQAEIAALRADVNVRLDAVNVRLDTRLVTLASFNRGFSWFSPYYCI